MSIIQQFENDKTILDFKNELTRFSRDPASILTIAINTLSSSLNNEIDIPDATNPFIFLMSVSAAEFSLAIQETDNYLFKAYPSLAQTKDDIYRWMSDNDYKDIFALPASNKFKFLIQINSLINAMIYDPNIDASYIVIPRDTEIKVNGYTFTIGYPITITYYKQSNKFIVKYDGAVLNDVHPINSYIIPSAVATLNDKVEYLFFDVDTLQYSISTSMFPITEVVSLKYTIPFNDDFFYIKVYFKTNTNNSGWRDVSITHTDKVYDIDLPTAIVKVLDGELQVYIPEIYLKSGLITGSLRIDVYTTKGLINLDLTNVPIVNFTTELKVIDEQRDQSLYTLAMREVSYAVSSNNIITDGRSSLNFEQLKKKVITNTKGNISIPITSNQLDGYAASHGFHIFRNIDTITNRVFLAVRDMPAPINPKLITPASVTVESYIANLLTLNHHDGVYKNNDSLIIPSYSLFSIINGKLTLLFPDEILAIKNKTPADLTAFLNENGYLYNIYDYVINLANNNLDVKAYDLDNPSIPIIKFVNHNTSIKLDVSTTTYEINRISNGFRISILTTSDALYKQIPDINIGVQICMKLPNTYKYVTINGIQRTQKLNDERIFDFILESNFDIDENNQILITNFNLNNKNDKIPVRLDLTTDLTLLYTTNSITVGYVPTSSDSKIKDFLPPLNSVAITEEIIPTTFGSYMEGLWVNSRVIPTEQNYKTYPSDVYRRYTENVFETDPRTGQELAIVNGVIERRLLHRIGELVLDESGQPEILHYAGDAVLDSNNNPQIMDEVKAGAIIDLLLVNGLYYFATDINYVNYRKEIKDVLNNYIREEITPLRDIVLEQTKIYFYPKKAIGAIQVDTGNDRIINLDSEQYLTVTIGLLKQNWNDQVLKDSIEQTIIVLINNFFSLNSFITTDAIEDIIKRNFPSIIQSIKVEGLGGDTNYQSLTLVNTNQKLSLKKILTVIENGDTIVKESVKVNFFKVAI